MIARGDELREAYQKIYALAHVAEHRHIDGKVYLPSRQGWPSTYTEENVAHQLDMERVRLLQTIAGSASIAGGIARKRRGALRDLPELLDQFGRQAPKNTSLGAVKLSIIDRANGLKLFEVLAE